MKKGYGWVLMCAMIGFSGCGMFRPAATEAQKANAWMHAQVCARAAESAAAEAVWPPLRELTALAAEQSEAFVFDYGLPREPVRADIETALREGGALAARAKEDAVREVVPWDAADGLLELGIAVAGLAGGVFGVRAAAFLRQAQDKTRALKEIVQGNELFKRLHPQTVTDFKQSHDQQSEATRLLVARLK